MKGHDAAHLRINVQNATDSALLQRLSPLGKEWLRYTKRVLPEKAHAYTVPKLFLFELLPVTFNQVITLDADVVALADVTTLFTHVQQLAAVHKTIALFFAAEQQNRYRWALNWTRVSHAGSPSPWPDDQHNGVNGGVCVQFLGRLRNSTTYRSILRRYLHGDVDKTVLVGGARELQAVKQFGDQTLFSAAAILEPRGWALMTRLLPCEWNWQTCVWSYARVNECPMFDGKIVCPPDARQPPLLHDSSCRRPPRLLHFDCPGDLKALLVSDGANHTGFSQVVGRGGAHLDEAHATQAVEELDQALKRPSASGMCRRAERRFSGLASSRFCNASFLLSRLLHASRGTPPRHAARHFGGIRGKAETSSKARAVEDVTDLDSKDVDTTRRRRRRLAERSPCAAGGSQLPRVYVYALGDVPANPYGVPLDADLRTTAASGPTFVNAIHARLHAMREVRPERADLFFIPEAAAKNDQQCTTLATRIDAYWQARGGGINYLRRRGGADHFTAIHRLLEKIVCKAWQTRDFENTTKAVGVLQSPWFLERRALPLTPKKLQLKPFMCNPKVHEVCPWLPNISRVEADDFAARQKIVEVPYGGSVHDPASWRRTNERPLLAVASFNGRGHRNFHRQMEVRRALLAQCRARSSKCRVIELFGRYNLANTDDPQGHKILVDTLSSYREAVFSFQPAGDDPARKGIIDSITSGCIPVVFYEQQQQLWPWHWRDWATESSILLPHDAVLNGSLDVLEALATIPQQRVAQMQATIRQFAHRLQYSLHTSVVEGDALEILLKNLRCSIHGGV